ncbi:DinB family protein [Archangium lipolyticum]|uniref:DinB family protein n=1 Tax=Archangium lipolyticum TaxID=2970465 RepID=UPI00214A4103|nr:DinB family protein [Archangium lipolyticum]
MNRAVLALAVLLPTLVLAAEPAATAKAAPKDSKFLVDYLTQTQKDFLKSIDGLSEAQWKFKPAPDRWSVAEVAEHIALSEEMFAENITGKVLKTPAATAEQKAKTQGLEEKILQGIPDRTNKHKAPEKLQPASKFASAKEAAKAFNTKREAIITLVKGTPESELRSHVSGPSPMGELDAYQWMLFTAAHSKRHIAQIEEVKADPNFPKK